MRSFRLLAAASAAALLVGCATTQPEIPYDHSTATPIKKIGLLSPSAPEEANVAMAATVGQSFGLIGALVDAGVREHKESEFDDAMKQRQFSAQGTLVEDLKKQLSALGYEVVVLPVTREKADFIEHYPSASDTNVDAYLDVVLVYYGYLAAGAMDSTPYRPDAGLRVRLVQASDASVLMQDSIIYNPIGVVNKAVTISPDAQYVFKDFDTLIADPAKASDGLTAALDQSAATIGTLLK